MKLNIGCGSDTWGDIRIDIDPKASAVNLIADAHYLPLPNDSIDETLCTEVLEHVESPVKVLKEIRRVLKPNGVCTITIPNIYEWRRVIWNIRHPNDMKEAHKKIDHKQAWDNLEFQSLCRQAEMKIKAVEYVSLANRKHRKLWQLDLILKWIIPKALLHFHVKYVLTKESKSFGTL